MYYNSTQRKAWIFPSLQDVQNKKSETLATYKINRIKITESDQVVENLLSEEEESYILRYYGQRLLDFCHNFTFYDHGERKDHVRVPNNVIFTAVSGVGFFLFLKE